MLNNLDGNPLPGTLTLIMRMQLNFACLIFVARTDYENNYTNSENFPIYCTPLMPVYLSVRSIESCGIILPRQVTP